VDWPALLAVLGIGAIFNTVVAWWLNKRAEHSRQKMEAVAESYTAQATIETSHVQDNAEMRKEIWGQLRVALERNDELSQELGVSRRESAELAGRSEMLQRQVTELVQRLSSRDMQIEELKRKFSKMEKHYDDNIAVVNEHVLALQRHIRYLETLCEDHAVGYRELDLPAFVPEQYYRSSQ
jgi:hypothetical protein